MAIMVVTAIIEKGSDGLYSVRTDAVFGNVCPGGFGESVSVAKKDFEESIDEAFELCPQGCIRKSDLKIEYRYDIQSFFNFFDYFNLSRLASRIGINESQMRQYKNGLAFPNEKTTSKILNGIHTIGHDLLSSSL